MRDAWAKAQVNIKKYYDNKHRDVQFSVGDWVLLSSRNIKLRRASQKLADKFLGPFQVVRRVGKNAYRLQLPQKYGRIHPTFHVSLLKPYHRRHGTEPPNPVDVEGEEEWLVEEILDVGGTGKRRKWLVKWQGWSHDHNTWEPREHLTNAQEAMQRFERKKRTQDG